MSFLFDIMDIELKIGWLDLCENATKVLKILGKTVETILEKIKIWYN